MASVSCPICSKQVKAGIINQHIDSNCQILGDEASPPTTQNDTPKDKASTFFSRTPNQRVNVSSQSASKRAVTDQHASDQKIIGLSQSASRRAGADQHATEQKNVSFSEAFSDQSTGVKRAADEDLPAAKPNGTTSSIKKLKTGHVPLAERMRPKSLDDVAGQELVGPNGVLRNLIVTDRVPSMILWGGPGCGKTTIARLLAQTAGTRFVEINSTSTGVAECKRLFDEARNELKLTGRKTIIFCDEIHRFSKSQQDVFLGPTESGAVTLIGATTENPSFKVVNALLSRCRTFTLSKLTEDDIVGIMKRALQLERSDERSSASVTSEQEETVETPDLLTSNDHALLRYLASFADGDARTALNLLEIALDLSQQPNTTIDSIKDALTQTLVYDRAGDQHYDTISAFHKSVRGSNADAALYYLARMLQSGEDPLYIARRMVVIASEDVGLADNSLLGLATATYTAAEKIGMPECRINLAHCAVALASAPKSVKAYRGLNAAYSALKEPGIAGLPVPIHLRNAPTKLMKELGYGREYKYNPDYQDGRVEQVYLPDKLVGRTFLPDVDLGDKEDPDLVEHTKDADILVDDEVLLGPDGD